MKDADTLEALLVKIAVPLFAIDEAKLWVVKATEARVHLHVAGAYAGCPGNTFVERSLLAPLVEQVFPKAELEVTSGWTVPKDARLLTEPRRSDRDS